MTKTKQRTSPTPLLAHDTAQSSAPRRSLRSTASASSLPRLPSSSRRFSGTIRGGEAQPTLADLMRDEEERAKEAERGGGGEEERKRTRQRRRSSAPLPGQGDQAGGNKSADAAAQATAGESLLVRPAASAFPTLNAAELERLLPPHYGRPSRPSSPDVLAALLRPVLQSLSRPVSPAASPLVPSSPTASHPPSPRSAAPPAPAAPTADRSASSLPSHFPPREATDPAPTVESQGFVLYIGSQVAFFAYLVWAFLPGEWLEWAGIEWYPSQEWALLIPAWVVMLVAFTYSSYFFLNMFNSPPLSSLSLLTHDPSDPTSKAFIPPPAPALLPDGTLGPDPLFAHSVLLDEDAIPPLYDLPVEWVNRVLYGEQEEEEGEEEEEEKKG
ncbi:hypothetical protein JCM6882_009281 [Rhodosporidiobolus microsporus]